ncbi:helix-turn-helix domain-containing protein [Kitasatospora sp. NPDC058397]|uniref:helix-turn-helix domain-containing protein n=1 Tax=unclassified Kitasatospora TaxID=2633591 RepID=UPI00364DFAE1
MTAPYQPDEQQIRDRRGVGARILSLRRQADPTQERLGERSGLDRRTIGRIENGLAPATPNSAPSRGQSACHSGAWSATSSPGRPSGRPGP